MAVGKSLSQRLKHKYIKAYTYNSETTNLALPDMGLFKAILSQAICATGQSSKRATRLSYALTIHERLLNLFPRGHHEWTVLYDLLIERFSRDLKCPA